MSAVRVVGAAHVRLDVGQLSPHGTAGSPGTGFCSRRRPVRGSPPAAGAISLGSDTRTHGASMLVPSGEELRTQGATENVPHLLRGPEGGHVGTARRLLLRGLWTRPHGAGVWSRPVSRGLAPPPRARLSSDEVLLHQKLNTDTVKLTGVLGSSSENGKAG